MASNPLDEILRSDVAKKIRKDYGDLCLVQASTIGSEPVCRLPTGIFLLDYSLGGGFPVGKLNVVWGHKGSTKTTTLLKTLAHAQTLCAECWQHMATRCRCKKAAREPVCAYLDVEGALDLLWAKRIGVQLDKLLLSRPEYAEQALDIGEALVRKGVDILVMDSIAFLTPTKEIEESVAKDLVGQQARQVGKGTRKFMAALNHMANTKGFDKVPTLLFTNQVRMKVGVMFGNPETQPGGLAHGFASSTETRFSPGKYVMDEVTGRPISATFGFRVEKNKTFENKMSGDFQLLLQDTEFRSAGSAINEPDMLKMGERLGLVGGAGRSWNALGETFTSKSDIEKKLVEDSAFYTKLWTALMMTLRGAA